MASSQAKLAASNGSPRAVRQTSARPETRASAVTVRLSDVAPEQVRWLWPQRIAIGKLTLLVGDPGLGKSFLTLDIAARVSRGGAWPDAPGIEQPAGDVLLLSAEDDLADTIRPRLDAHGADVGRILAVRGTRLPVDGEERPINLAADLEAIRAVAAEAHQPRLLIVDPVSAFMGRTDSHKNAEVRGVLAPLAELAGDLGMAVLAVSHLRKGDGAALYRTMGSLAFVAAARSAWVVCRDEAEATRRLLLPLKNNLAPDVGGLAFSVQQRGPQGAAVVCWEAGAVQAAADDLIGGDRKRGPEPRERGEAAVWLRHQLADGPRPKVEIIEAGRELKFSERTLRRALGDIGGSSRVSGFPAVAVWSASLDSGTRHTQHGQPGQRGPTE